MPKACVAADKALEIDPSLGEAHATRAFISWLYDCDPQAAENRFRRAIALNPGYSTAHQWYAAFLAQQGHNAKALAEIDLLDPFSLQINTAVVQVLYCGRAYDEAIEYALKTLDLDSTFATAHLMLSVAYLRKRLFADGLRAAEKAAEFSGQSAAALACIGGCHAASGRTDEALATVEPLQALSQERHVSPYLLSWIHGGLQDKENATANLEQAHVQRSTYLALVRTEPVWDFLRSDPRFQDLQRRVDLLP